MLKNIRYVPVISILFGIYWLAMGVVKYGFWTGTAPGAGFFPAVVGAMLIGFSLWILTTPVVLNKGSLHIRAFYPVFIAVAGLLAVYLVGFLIAMGLLMIAWLLFVEKLSLQKSLIVAVSATVVIYFVFKVWLMVPFPTGLLGII
ncbi:MAG: tripartite tricarboxylate transporter TctB family protein [Peptococcaceae bacterium]